MKEVATAFALWLASHGLYPNDTSQCDLRAVVPDKDCWWACYACYSPRYDDWYLGAALLKCDSKWCVWKRDVRGYDLGTCEKSRQ